MELRIEEDELTCVELDGGGTPIWEYQGKRFTGILIIIEKDGTLGSEQECQDGFEEGWYRAYHKNGTLIEEYKIHYNIVVPGTFKTWDEEGNFTGGW